MKTPSIAVVLVLLALSRASALVIPVPIEEMPSKADFVVVGEVLDKTCRWDDRGIAIFTDYVVAVKDRILGKTDDILFMSFAGGTVGGHSIFVTDVPRLEVGKTYLLFGLGNEKSSSPVVGSEQGVFHVVHDRVLGKEFIVDYDGNLLEKMPDGSLVRGRPVDLSVADRLTFVERKKEEKEPPAPKPVVRDYAGKVTPQPEFPTEAKTQAPQGAPVEKDAFIAYITRKAQK